MARQLASMALAVILLFGTVVPAAANAATDRIREFFGSVNRLITDPTYDDRMPERLGALQGLVVEVVDFRTAAAVALGTEWAARTTSERDEFAGLFADLLQTSMFSSIGARARIDNGLTVTYVGELADRNGVTVATSVLLRNGGEMAVGYRMVPHQGRWVVHDVVVDGVSLVDNYRAQFQKVISRSSYAGLVSEMRTRIADLGRPNAVNVVTAAPPMAIVAKGSRVEAPAPEPAPVAVAAPTPVLVAVTPREVAPPEHRAIDAPRAIVDTRAVEPRAGARMPDPPPLEMRRPAPTPVVVAAVPPPAAPRTTPEIAYWVQVGAFRNMEKAIGMATALRDQDVSLVTAPDYPLMRLLVGPFTDRAAAASKLRELRARGYDPFIAEASK